VQSRNFLPIALRSNKHKVAGSVWSCIFPLDELSVMGKTFIDSLSRDLRLADFIPAYRHGQDPPPDRAGLPDIFPLFLLFCPLLFAKIPEKIGAP
jgi:hypothetical protein